MNTSDTPVTRPLTVALKATLLTALYVLGIWYATAFVVGPSSVTLFWPAAGVGFAAVVGFGPRWAAIIPAAVLVAHLSFVSVPVGFVPFSMLGNLLGALAGATVLHVARTMTPHRSISVLAILGGALAMSAVAAAIGTAGLLTAGMVPAAGAAAAFMKWALGDLLGIACVAPTLLLLVARTYRGKDAPLRSDYAPMAERAVWVLTCAGAYLFLFWVGSQDTAYALGMVAFPLALLVWAAFRFGRLWTAVSTAAAVFVVTSLTGLGLSAFRSPESTLDTLLLLAFLNVFAILPLMLMETIHGQRVGGRRSLRLLAEAAHAQHAQLEDLVAERTRQLDEANHQLEEASQTDVLTGLRNRRYAARQLPLDVAFYAREARSPHALPHALFFALVDIDHFKRINDTLGHKAGDDVLQQFALVLAGLVRSSDYAIRWGGEEFLLVLRPMPGESVETIGARICSEVAAHRFRATGHAPLSITCSVGFAEQALASEAVDLHWEHMVELADAALYWVKHHGRNNWAVLSAAPGVTLDTLVARLRDGTQAAVDDGLAAVRTGKRTG
ncbi:sensor domain-containing diguanylate cyclase [Luteimonas deserti]|uniref:diguanylate cyclase n=1 Tax=Luteimonas deserti TaxID=2752306 RepID=A0A7Z0TYL3_9GAMM|nr:diguanylate cyclase [Luteimonas deserti]NYZ63035.1 sensor domain-containing diguanylate cyclase [Luteimonas deserti]